MKNLPAPGFTKASVATEACECCLDDHGGDLETCRFWHNADHKCRFRDLTLRCNCGAGGHCLCVKKGNPCCRAVAIEAVCNCVAGQSYPKDYHASDCPVSPLFGKKGRDGQ